MNKIIKHKHVIGGYIGMLILQSNNIPLIMQSLNGMAVNIISPMQTICGLTLYLIYSIQRGDWLYTIGNSIGLTLAATLLIINL